MIPTLESRDPATLLSQYDRLLRLALVDGHGSIALSQWIKRLTEEEAVDLLDAFRARLEAQVLPPPFNPPPNP